MNAVTQGRSPDVRNPGHVDGVVFLGEMRDKTGARTQLLALLLAARF